MERKLAAILAADVVGYSRLMEIDEAGTLEALKAHRAALIDPAIAERRGRIVKLMGDGSLVEFASVVDAVACALAIQDGMSARNEGVAEDRRMAFRIGVHLGDVIVEGDDLYGDGVNVAARLEGLAEPGGVCISQQAYDQVETKLDLAYEDLGEQQVKNIARLVRTYRILLDGEAPPGAQRPKTRGLSAGQLIGSAAVMVLVVTGLVLGWWQPWKPDVEPASMERMAIPLPEKPSIAVLPFTNMSGDPEQEYFADGMTEDLITDLSKISGLFVIARNSTFTYKGKTVAISLVAEELGVRYVLEGSVRRAGDQVRINVQLIDAGTGGHLWAERYDGELGDVFALQDRVTRKIIAQLAVRLTADEQARLVRAETKNPAAYDAFLQGWGNYRQWNLQAFGKAVPHFKKAVELDPEYSRAYAALASIYYVSWRFWGEKGEKWPEGMGVTVYYEALDVAKKYLRLAMRRPTPLAHRVASLMHLRARRYEEAIAEAEQALALDPNDADSHAQMAAVLTFAGRAGDAIRFAERAMRLDPHYPPRYLGILGRAEFSIGRLDEAAILFERLRERNPDDQIFLPYHAAAYALLDRDAEARAVLADYKGYTHTITAFSAVGFKKVADFERFARGLVKAGVCCRDELERLLVELRQGETQAAE